MLAAHVGSKIDAERGRAMGLLECHGCDEKVEEASVHMMPSPSPAPSSDPRPALPLVKYPATRRQRNHSQVADCSSSVRIAQRYTNRPAHRY